MVGTRAEMKRYSVQEAAEFLGISERGIRKRIEAKTLAAERDGHRWWVLLPVVQGSENGIATEAQEQIGTSNGSVPGTEPELPGNGEQGNGTDPVVLQELLVLLKDEKEHVRELERLNMELAGQVGFLQGQLALAHEEITLLQAPQEDTSQEETKPDEKERGKFWRRFWSRAYGRV